MGKLYVFYHVCVKLCPMDSQSGISQLPLIVSSSTFKPKSMGPNQNLKLLALKTTFYGRHPFMEDQLKIVMVEYLSNHLLDLAHNLNFRLGEEMKIENCCK